MESGFYATPGSAAGVAVSGNCAYVADTYYFEIFDCSQAIQGEEQVTITLPLQENYFELISTYLLPVNLNAASVFGEVEHLEIVYQDDGSIYVPPPLDINTIGDIDIREGYQIFCSMASELTLRGVPSIPRPSTPSSPAVGIFLAFLSNSQFR